jgi:transcription initiation factor TFIID/TFIIF subunit
MPTKRKASALTPPDTPPPGRSLTRGDKPQAKRTVKLITRQNVLPDEPPEAEGFPMRGWSISIYLVGPNGDDMPANCFEKAVYVLHESFGPKRARQTFKSPPFTIKEKGWGEFDMQIILTPVGAGGKSGNDITLNHDLNFQQEVYESTHVVVSSTIQERVGFYGDWDADM